MKPFVLLAFVAASFSVFASAEHEMCSHAMRAARLFKSPVKPMALELTSESDVLNLNLDLEVVPSTQTLTGTAVHQVRANKTGGLAEFNFRLSNNFTITNATVNGIPITVTRLDAANLRANLDRTYAVGEEFSISISYTGVPSAGSGFGSIKIGNRTGTIPYFETLSEPFYAYTWWPSKESNTDKFTSTVSITAPNNMVSVSNGLLTNTTALSGNRNKMTWVSNYPIVTYNVAVGSSNYNLYPKTWTYGATNMPVNFYIWPEQDSASVRTQCDNVLGMLTGFSNRFGIYPFSNEKYAIYQFTFGGGMEHQTATGQINFGESLSSHELGHQWWGDMITCGAWGDIWLNEGFATYCEAIWLEVKPGSTGLPALRSAMNARRPSSVNGSVFRTDTTNVGSIFSSTYSYRKGGWVLHMLRKVMGEAGFWQGLSDYRNQFQYSSAVTSDLKNVMSNIYGSDLSWFFDEWIYQYGAPNYTWGWANKTLNGKNYVAVSIQQTQTNTAPWPSAFKMPLEFRYTDGTTQNKTLWNSARNQWYLFPTPGTASAPALDPDDWVLIPTKTTGTYTQGPPKVLSVIPGTGTNATATTFVLSSPISVNRTKISVKSGATAKRFTYNLDTTGTRLTVNVMEKGPNLVISLLDTITGTDSGLALDGERVGFPSGDGVPGGAFTYNYTRGVLTP